MHRVIAVLLFILAAAMLPACAPRVAVVPVSPELMPFEVADLVRQKETGVNGIRALVKVTAQEKGGEPVSFDGMLIAAKPDKVRLTGLSFMGFTVFDAVIRDGKYYFYQPDTGAFYTGPRAQLVDLLGMLGIKADPELIYRALFFETSGTGYETVYDNRGDGYSFYLAREDAELLIPYMRADYDAGLNLQRKVFYDGIGRPYIEVVNTGLVEVDGNTLPRSIKATDSLNGYSVEITFDNYQVNPEGLEEDFKITGGELKEIRTLE